MPAPSTIAADAVVSIHYTLTLNDGAVVDSSQGGEPLDYLHGHGNLVPGLEQQLAGHAVGEQLQAVVPPGDGYGERDPEGVQTVPRDAFPGDMEIESGMQFQAEGEDGEPTMLVITAVEGDQVTVDLNHPLAGETLNFEIVVEAIREATAEELQHGHVHGPHGHAH